jgi:lipid A 3-O-deacylase
MKASLFAVLLLCALPAPCLAGEAFLGAYAHDVDDQVSFGHTTEGGAQIIGGYRTAPIPALTIFVAPRAHAFGAVNTRGGVSFASAGLTWRFPIGRRFYLQPGVGLAVHNAEYDFPSPFEPGLAAAERQRRLDHVDRDLDLGSRVLLAPELSLGWQATERAALELSWIHLSHAQLAGKQNPGLGEVGLRAVYRFGGP